MRPPIIRSYDHGERRSVINRLEKILAAEQIGIKSENRQNGLIVTDSLDLTPELCDCGKNMIGAEYPGHRRGVLTIKVSAGTKPVVSMDLKARLRISANNIIVQCASRGVLEEKLLTALEQEFGATTTR